MDLRQSLAIPISNSEKYPREKEFLYHKNSEIEFLYNNYKEFKEVHGVLTVIEKMPLCYNLLKYYIVLKRKFIDSLTSGKICQQYQKEMVVEQMRAFMKTDSFKKQLKEFQEQEYEATVEFEALHGDCKVSLNMIHQINTTFKECFHDKITET